MKRMSLLLPLLCSVFLVAGTAFAGVMKAKHSVELSDAAGDVKGRGKDPGKDVVKVAIDSDGKHINITVMLKEKASYYLDNHHASNVLAVNFDTDNDPATGGNPSWSKKTGFEYKVGVSACIDYKGGGQSCMGALKNEKSKGFFSGFQTMKYEQGKSTGETLHMGLDSTHKDIKGREISISVPYSEMGLASGQVVRLAIREEDSDYDEKSYFPDVLLTLK